MMFFLARSALCIGVVAAAASGLGTRPFATAVDGGVRDAVSGAGRACLASEDCLRAGTTVLSTAARASGAPSPRRPEARASRTAPAPGG